jgi:glycosyltransferase involved in cell wall biosynthesis
MTLKVFAVNESDAVGGAARAAARIHRALRQRGVESTLWVERPVTGDKTVEAVPGEAAKVMRTLRPLAGHLARRVLRTPNPVLHSAAVLPSSWPDRLNRAEVDVVHLHWICGEMMSVEDIGRIRKPIVWSLHDMWPFCGAEHYTDDSRWESGYESSNRPPGERGLDLNRWTWRRKRRAWSRPMHIAAPSQWLANCAKRSALMRDWPVSVIPNPIDANAWEPVDKPLARRLLGLPADGHLLAFGAMGGGRDPRKGLDLLVGALRQLNGSAALRLVVFGQSEPREVPEFGCPVHYTGHLHDDVSLRLLYSAADALVIPSRQDNLPNTGVEALACGVPVIAFDTGGLPDIVQHQTTGWLARAFDAIDLAEGIRWTLSNDERRAELGRRAREAACRRFSPATVADQYVHLYEQVLREQSRVAVPA